MKRLKKSFLVMVCLVALLTTFTACIGSDNEDNYVYIPLTQAEKAVQINNIAGSYTGKARLYQINGYGKIDSADVSLTVATDSTLNISNFPLRLLTNGLTNETLKTALATQTAPFNSNVYLYKPIKIEQLITNYQNFHFFNVWNAALATSESKWNVQLPYTYNGQAQMALMELSKDLAPGINLRSMNLYNKSTNTLVFYLVPQQVKWDDTLNVEPFNGVIVITVKK